MRAQAGDVVEVFSSVQGEGPHVGRRHIFVRLAGCGFGCRRCDQPAAQNVPAVARIERSPGARRFREWPNPVGAAELAAAVCALDDPPGLHHAFAITGGEPLEQAGFLESLLPLLAEAQPQILLETNGVLPDELERVLPWVDIVSMDFKAASVTGVPTPLEQTRRFLAAALAKDVYVKMLVAEDTADSEIVEAARLVAELSPGAIFVLQPVASWSVLQAGAAKLLRMQAMVSGVLSDVRVIGQMHRMLGMM